MYHRRCIYYGAQKVLTRKNFFSIPTDKKIHIVPTPPKQPDAEAPVLISHINLLFRGWVRRPSVRAAVWDPKKGDVTRLMKVCLYSQNYKKKGDVTAMTHKN